MENRLVRNVRTGKIHIVTDVRVKMVDADETVTVYTLEDVRGNAHNITHQLFLLHYTLDVKLSNVELAEVKRLWRGRLLF